MLLKNRHIILKFYTKKLDVFEIEPNKLIKKLAIVKKSDGQDSKPALF